MIRKLLLIVLALTVTGAIGMLILEKVQHTRAIDRCHARGGTWNFMDQQCDNY